jgi:hypothetical protein
MSPLAKTIRAFHHMSYQERLLWIIGVSAVLYFLFSTFRDGWRSWTNKRTRKRLEDASRKEWEDHGRGHIAGRYRLKDTWLKKIGYPRRGGKSDQN